MKHFSIEGRAAGTRTHQALPQLYFGLGYLLLVALLVWWNVPTFASLHPVWLEDYNYSHGYLVLGVTVFLVVAELRRSPLEPLAPSWLGAGCLVALAFVTTAARAASTVAIAHLLLPLVWMAAVWALAGAKNLRRLVMPLGFLYFAIPVWDVATEPLRAVTIVVVSMGIRLLDVPAFIEGNLIHLPSGTFEVAGGCAGLRYAIVAATLGAFLGLLHYRHWRPVLLLTLCALALALVGNWVRVFIMVLVGHYSEMQNYLIVEDHSVFGWVVFVLFMAPLFFVHRALPFESTPSGSPAIDNRVATAPVHARRSVAFFAGVGLALCIWLDYRIDDGFGTEPGLVLTAPDIPGWNRGVEWQDSRRPQFVGASAEVSRWYETGTARVGAYLAHYARQGQGHEIVFSQHRPQGEASVVSRRSVTVEGASSGATLAFDELEVTDFGGQRRLVWIGLRVAGRTAGSEAMAKFLQVVGAIRGRRDAQALVLTAECAETCSKTTATLSGYAAVAAERFYEQAGPSVPRKPEDDIS